MVSAAPRRGLLSIVPDEAVARRTPEGSPIDSSWRLVSPRDVAQRTPEGSPVDCADSWRLVSADSDVVRRTPEGSPVDCAPSLTGSRPLFRPREVSLELLSPASWFV